MASYTSSLRFVQPADGDPGWGGTVNNGFTALADAAIAGTATVDVTASNQTLAPADGAADDARKMVLNITGTPGTARNVVVPSVSKIYVVKNGADAAVTVKTSASGVAVPVGKSMVLRVDGTDVVQAVDHLGSLTLDTPLAAASGGTGLSALGAGVATWLGTPSSANLAAAVTGETGSGALVFGTSPTLVTPNLGTPSAATLTNATGLPIVAGTTGTLSVARGGTGVTTSTGSGNVVLSTSPTLTTPNLGTPSAVTLTNATGLPLTTGVTGTLPVANGGTGITSFGTGVATWLGTPSSANLAAAVTDETGSGALVFGTSPTLTTPNLGTPSAATLTNATGLPLSTGVTGTLPVANGGTGITSFGTGVATALGQNVTGSGGITLATSPTISGPTISGQASFADGSAAAPSITNTGDINTGIFFPSADTIGIAVGGFEAARFNSVGSFYLNVTALPSAIVHGTAITQTGGGAIWNSRSTTGIETHVFFINPNGTVGSITTSGSSTSFNVSSDVRLKTNIAPSDEAGSLLDAINVVQFDWKVGGHSRYGVIAQELNTVVPEAVSEGDELERPWGVDYSKLVPLLVKEIQSLRARVAALEAV